MKKSLCVLLLVSCVASWAAPSSGTASAAKSPAELLAELEAARAVAKARVDVAKQEAELAAVKKEHGGSGSATPPPGSPPPSRAAQPGKAASAANAGSVYVPGSLPVVVSMSGVGDQFTAEVSLGDVRRTVRTGDLLPGGLLVTNIDASGVTFLQAGKTMKLRP